MTSLQSKIKLSNGREMPRFGLGVYEVGRPVKTIARSNIAQTKLTYNITVLKSDKSETYDSVTWALEVSKRTPIVV